MGYFLGIVGKFNKRGLNDSRQINGFWHKLQICFVAMKYLPLLDPDNYTF